MSFYIETNIIAKMTKEEYERLLTSDYWKGFSYSLIKERNFTCEDCGRSFYNQRNKLQVHHLVYRDINPWSYKPEEMVVLCEECHKRRHGIYTAPETYTNTTYNHNANGDYTKSYSYSSENKKEGTSHTDTFLNAGGAGGSRIYYSNNLNLSNQKIPPVLKILFVVPLCFFVLILGFGIYMMVKPDDRSIYHDFRSTSSYTQSEDDNGGYTEKEVQEIVGGSREKETSDIEEELTPKTHSVSSTQAEHKTPATSSQSTVAPVPISMEKDRASHPEQSQGNTISTQSNAENESGLSTLEILERKQHADVVKRAQRAGVSTEGTTLEIMERMQHADVVKRAQRAGVSTEGTTLEIMERMQHADVVKRAQRAGVSTEGSTLEIMERINRKNMQKMGY